MNIYIIKVHNINNDNIMPLKLMLFPFTFPACFNNSK